MKKITIIDDDPETVKLLETLLKTRGYETTSVRESNVAFSEVENLMPDLVILDIMMPEINGITICKQIKSTDRTRHIKVVMLTALSDESTRRDCLNAGASQVLNKPIFPRILTQEIEDLLAEKFP
jgi:two-component system phosphate regulon response regulator PhoB